MERHTTGDGDTVLLRSGAGEWKKVARRVARGRRLLLSVGPAVPVDDVVLHIGRKGLAVTDVVPYGGLAGGVLTPQDRPYRWQRVLSWLGEDAQLTALATTLEERWVSQLHPAMAVYRFVVAERRSDSDRDRWQPPAPDTVPEPDERLALEVESLSTRASSRYFLFLVTDAVAARMPGFDPATLLTPRRLEEYAGWHNVQRIDEEVTALARDWSGACVERWRDGLDVTVAVDYELVRQLLEQHHGRFPEIAR